MRVDLQRWSVFNAVGFAGFLAQIAVIAVLTRWFDWQVFAATLAGLELAALQNFVGHSWWTWGNRPAQSPRDWLRRYWRYQVAKTAGLAANLFITTALAWIGVMPEAANTAAVLACAIPNYLAAEHFVFHQSS